ncbi:hydrogen peroxide-inducible genes activator [Niabella beijingensis]|uniref:hydrogen peroxide-inducible genes activator n=1 Tax=Niabella beijingensis TaxID=2872700 RepID=UPI001CBE9118|nr:hydrogen peroxide-inducible genes activator [Niabella beijingensis]MBZ4188597.1 hydrogen peroxide-inducible genes activator [Niabella beijingensis]
MTFVQLEYIIALEQLKHFARAAAHCHVTQPSLSMQVQKLEEELGVTLFDRSKQPVVPTETGRLILEQARTVLAARDVLLQQVQHRKGVIAGELRIGIIPTLAPYLLPLFVKPFAKKYPAVRLVVQEMMTEHIVRALREDKVDAGILVTPLQEAGIREHVLFYEELMVYVSRKHSVYHKTYVIPQDIDPDRLWLLEEGHCFRSQIANLCELKKLSREHSLFDYEAGSIETLRRMVEVNEGITILPELATLGMPPREMLMIRHFKKPAPMREVSLVVHRNFMKQKLIELLKKEITGTIPEKIRNNKPSRVVPVNEH